MKPVLFKIVTCCTLTIGWVVFLLLPGCSANIAATWEQLAEQSLIELNPANSAIIIPGGEPGMESSFRTFAAQKWPGTQILTDAEFLVSGCDDKHLLLLGTPTGNLALKELYDSKRAGIAIGADCISAASRHMGDDLVVWIRYPLSQEDVRRIFILSGTSAGAILETHINAEITKSEYAVIQKNAILESGFFATEASSTPLSSAMIWGENLVFVVPEDKLMAYTAKGYSPAISDRKALKDGLKNRSAFVVGTMNDNQFLARILEDGRIKISPDAIAGRYVHPGKNLLLYAKIPYPDEKNSTTRILAANNSSTLPRYDFFYPGHYLIKSDYVIFDAQDKRLEIGLYSENERTVRPVDRPKTAKERMLEDFDLLIYYLAETFVAGRINRTVHGIDPLEKLQAFRSRITGNESPAEFSALVNLALRACKGSHMGLFGGRAVDFSFSDHSEGYPRNPSFMTTAYVCGKPNRATVRMNQYYADAFLEPYGIYRISEIPLLYYQKNYYTKYDFFFQGKCYARGLKLRSINGYTTEEILRCMQDRASWWDHANKIFYHQSINEFFAEMNYRQGDHLLYLFESSTGEIIPVAFTLGERVFWPGKNHSFRIQKEPQVAFLDKCGILYLRIPVMQSSEPYLEQFKNITDLAKIKAVVIDIRSNPGGASSAWVKILANLIAQPITYIYHNIKKDTNLARDYLGVPTTIGFHEFWQDERVASRNLESKIVPDSDSLALSVPFFLLAKDIYSAAGNMFTFLNHNTDTFITIGERNPLPIGEGGSPQAFLLPNSNIVFQTMLSVNVAGRQTPAEVLYPRPQVELTLSLEELLDYWNMDASLPLEERLTKHDPYFKKVLELMRQNPPERKQ